MGDGSDQLPQGLHLLALYDFNPQIFVFGDIPKVNDDFFSLVVGPQTKNRILQPILVNLNLSCGRAIIQCIPDPAATGNLP